MAQPCTENPPTGMHQQKHTKHISTADQLTGLNVAIAEQSAAVDVGPVHADRLLVRLLQCAVAHGHRQVAAGAASTTNNNSIISRNQLQQELVTYLGTSSRSDVGGATTTMCGCLRCLDASQLNMSYSDRVV